MSITVDDLLAGPRGRRLCWAHAVRCGDAAGHSGFTTAVFHAAYHRSVAQGSGVVRFGPGADEPAPDPTTAEIATLLDEVPISVPDGTALLDLLDIAVNAATYWQPPDGEDVLAAEPELRPGLTRIAGRIAAAPGTAWWTTTPPLDRQSSVTWVDPLVTRRGRTDPATALAAQHAETLDDERRARRERPADPTAPFSGLWWSRPSHDVLGTTRDLDTLGGPAAVGPVGLWLVEDSLGFTRADVAPVRVDPAARVLEIDGPDAWAELCRRHPLDVTAARRHDWYRTTGRTGDWVIPDWAAVAAEVDAVHLTVRGWLTTSGRAVDVADGVASVLAGWDPDRTYWLTGAAVVDGPGEPWHRDDDGAWMPG